MNTQKILLYANDFLAYFFFSEMILKLVALHPKNYFKDNYNCFDAIVVLLSLVDIVIKFSFDAGSIGDNT